MLTIFTVKTIHYNFKENTVKEETLLAITDNTFKVTYHGNGGLLTDGTAEMIAGGDITDDTQNSVNDCSFIKEGYSFVSWNTKADGTGTTYNVGDKITSLELELYAIWKKNEDSIFKITYHGNGGLLTDGTAEMIAGGDITDDTQNSVNDCSFAKEGYSFVSWNTKADGTGTTYNVEDKITSLELELYAIWKKNDGTNEVKPVNPTKPTDSEKTEEPKKDNTSINENGNLPIRKDIDEVEDNPKTGNKDILIVSGGMALLAVICYSTLNKKGYFKKI